ncbi:MAG: DUF4838 domain-containing protein [Lentisphaeria bacterium]
MSKTVSFRLFSAWSLFFLLVLSWSQQSSSRELTLVSEGTPLTVLVLAEKPTTTAWYSAMELQHHIELISNAKINIVHENNPLPDGVRIFIGDTQFAHKQKIDPQTFDLEESLIRFIGNDIILIGRDQPAFAKPVYGTDKVLPGIHQYHKATLWASYNFLERYLGVHWYAPGEAGIAFSPTKTIRVTAKDLQHVPSMRAERTIYMPRLYADSENEFSKEECKMFALRWRYTDNYGICNHNVYSIWYKYYKPAKDPNKAKFFVESRPQYFAQGYKGKSASHLIALRTQYPNDPDLPPQLCNSNPEVIKHFAEEAVDIFQDRGTPGLGWHVGKMADCPWYYPIEPDDNLAFCQCPDCLNYFKNKQVDGQRATNYIHWDWISRIARCAAEQDSAVNIVSLAYHNTLKYPHGLELAPNVGVQLCIHPYDFWRSGSTESTGNNWYQEWIDAGEPKRRMVNIWTYMFSGSWYAVLVEKHQHFFPMFAHRHTGPLFKKFVRDGIAGWFGETSAEVRGVSFFHTQLETYIASQMAFDASQDSEQLINDFFKLYYGRAAAPMTKFYDLVEKAAWEETQYPKGKLVLNEAMNWGMIGTAERMKLLAGYVAEAEQLAVNDMEKSRLDSFRKGIWDPALKGRAAYEKKQLFRKRPVPEVQVAIMDDVQGDPLKIDWKKAAGPLEWKTIMGFPTNPGIHLKFAYDTKFFYLYYTEPVDTNQFKADPNFWSGDIIEMFFARTPERPYSQIAILPSGEMKAYAYYYENMVAYSGEISPHAVVKSEVQTDRWTLYIALPLDELIPNYKLQPGDSFHANIFRGSPGAIALSWSPVFDISFHELARMGKITLLPETGTTSGK